MMIVVNHLTRVQVGVVCVAGIDIERMRHVRPVISGSRLTSRLLVGNGGCFELGYLVDLGQAEYVGQPPELEDYHFDTRKVFQRGKVSASRFWQLLQKVSRGSLAELFGSALHPYGRGGVVEVGMGEASLGLLKLEHTPELYLDEHGRIRIGFSDGKFKMDLSVTDLRLYQEDFKTPKRELVEKVAGWCRAEPGTGMFLSVGLSRAWQKPDDSRERHWLQANNLHFEQHPVW
ncbi:MAG: hypothetical protein HXX20_14840 [Chloroflexi bacterium]|nr:hypothetical protein [Chloroflexota bacterium]